MMPLFALKDRKPAQAGFFSSRVFVSSRFHSSSFVPTDPRKRVFLFGGLEMTEDRILRLPQVVELTGRKRATIYADMKEGKFPASVRLGLRAIGWKASVIQEWIAGRENSRTTKRTPSAAQPSYLARERDGSEYRRNSARLNSAIQPQARREKA